MAKYGLELLAAAVFLFGSCKEKEIYPDTPSIKFKSYYFVTDPDIPTDTLLGVVFTYKDGDGDIGLNRADTLPPYDKKEVNEKITNRYYYNLFVDYFEMWDGKWYPVLKPSSTDTFSIPARVGSLTPEGKHKAIRGDIDYRFLPPVFGVRSDSIKLRITICDRALHESNTIESPVIVLR